MRGESGRSYPPRVMVALRAPPPQSSEISGGFPVANCTGSMKKKKKGLLRQAWLNVSLFFCF